MKAAVEVQLARDPQRATLCKRAIAGVEEGLSYLGRVGYNFEPAPKGTLAAQEVAEPTPETLSIDEAIGAVLRP